MTVNDAVPTAMVPVREVEPGFAAAVYCAVPLPDPDPVATSQSALFDVAVQVQPVVTENDPDPPEKLTAALLGETP